MAVSPEPPPLAAAERAVVEAAKARGLAYMLRGFGVQRALEMRAADMALDAAVGALLNLTAEAEAAKGRGK